ncbi:MAG: VWA domain-containing protein [Planctomycetes bacterium]|nr:VWA domain-containing protein [Planctomycetota bacterium]
MVPPLLACLAFWFAALPWLVPSHDPAMAAEAVVAPSPATADDKAQKALAAWLKHYRTGKMHLRPKTGWQVEKIDAKDSYAVKFGLAPKEGLGNPTWAGDLEVILEQVAKLDSPAAALDLLEIASTGIDANEYTREMAPHEVRAAGEKWLDRIIAQNSRDEIAKAARGDVKTEKGRLVALQVAGMRWLGRLREPAARTILPQQLVATDALLRVAAAESLGELADESTAPALIGSLEREASDLVLPAVAQATRKVFAKYLAKAPSKPAEAAPEANGDTAGGAKGGAEGPAEGASGAATKPPAAPPPVEAPESLRLAVRAAAKALGRCTWRSDLALVDLLDDFRGKEAVPALIGVLERFRDHPQDVQSGKLSGLLLHRTHELLVGMTGAIIPANQPDKWRALWEQEQDKIDVVQKRPTTGAGNTSAGDFCGIPVQGTRVLFVLDLSGSMNFAMKGADGANKAGSTRLDFAKRELLRAMDALAGNAQFNIITFNGNPKPVTWQKDMVPATDKNRERFRKYVNDLRADGGTNLWCALEEALKMKSVVYGDRYETNMDELFVLSDGAPSVGDVVDPQEILRLVRECNRFSKLRIHTVFISSAEPRERQPAPWMSITPERMMELMASQNGGKFVNL